MTVRTFCFLRACFFEDCLSICNIIITTLLFQSFTIGVISIAALLENIVSV